MNFLAHSMISFTLDEQTLFGNFAGDFYKGRIAHLAVAAQIKNGIMLHRLIDSTTDRRENFLNPLLAPQYGIFKGIIADIFIDHFVAKQFKLLFGQELVEVEREILSHIQQHQADFPAGFASLFHWLSHNHALSRYADVDFLRNAVFTGISQRVTNGKILLSAADTLQNHYAQFETAAIEEFHYTQRESMRKFLAAVGHIESAPYRGDDNQAV